jgi:hypothetical protein
MSSRGTSQAGSSGRPPPGPTMGHVTRSNTHNPNLKKGKVLTAGEQAQLMLADENCMHTEKAITPVLLSKIFKRLLE